MNEDGKVEHFSKEKSIVLSNIEGKWTVSYFDCLENPITVIDQHRAEKALAVSYRRHKLDLMKKRATEKSNG